MSFKLKIALLCQWKSEQYSLNIKKNNQHLILHPFLVSLFEEDAWHCFLKKEWASINAENILIRRNTEVFGVIIVYSDIKVKVNKLAC